MVEIIDEKQRRAEEICLDGINLCEQKDFAAAHSRFIEAHQTDPASPKIQSWLGLTYALVERKVQLGREFCERAVKSNIPDVMFFCNLGKCFLLLGNKRAAVAAFSRGLQIDKGNRAVLEEWKVMGFRRKPFLRFLPRENWLNVKIGKLTYRPKK